jgi:hypothetical protein
MDNDDKDLMQLSDGIPCPNGLQCKKVGKTAKCVSQALLNPNFGWEALLWDRSVTYSL